MEKERRKHIEDKDALKEVIHQLRVKFNQLTFENSKLTKAFEVYKEDAEIEKMNASHIYENVINTEKERGEIQQRLRAIQD